MMGLLSGHRGGGGAWTITYKSFPDAGVLIQENVTEARERLHTLLDCAPPKPAVPLCVVSSCALTASQVEALGLSVLVQVERVSHWTTVVLGADVDDPCATKQVPATALPGETLPPQPFSSS